MNAESLLNFRRIMKLHEGILKKVCEEYQLTLTEDVYKRQYYSSLPILQA